MDFAVLNRGERLAGIAGILLIIIMFVFDWFGLKLSGGTGAFAVSVEGGRNAWGSYGFTDIILFITGLAAIGVTYLAGNRQQLNLPVAASAIVTALGILSLILVLISILSPPDLGFSGPGINHSRKIGVWLGLIAVAALTYGAYLVMQEEGTSLGREADRLRDRRTGRGGPPPPPPGSGSGTGGPPPSA